MSGSAGRSPIRTLKINVHDFGGTWIAIASGKSKRMFTSGDQPSAKDAVDTVFELMQDWAAEKVAGP